MDVEQRADDNNSQQHSRYENTNHIISKREAKPSHICEINPPPCDWNAPHPYEYGLPKIEPIVVYEKLGNPVLTAQNAQHIPKLEINLPTLTQGDELPIKPYGNEANMPLYKISDREQLADPNFWTHFLSQHFNIDDLNNGNQSFVFEVVEPSEITDWDKPAVLAHDITGANKYECTTETITQSTESPDCESSSREKTTEVTECASTTEAVPTEAPVSEQTTTKVPPKTKSSFEVYVIDELKRINEKLDQNDEDEHGDDYECDYCCGICAEGDKDIVTVVTEPITEKNPDHSERADKIRRALAALLKTVHSLQSRKNNEILQMFRKHHRRGKH